MARVTRSRAGGRAHSVAVDRDLGLRSNLFIDYRRLSMDEIREHAAVWASWFRALGDPSRIVILNLLATAGREMTVGEIVEEVGLAQSTVSHHLKMLGDVRFILVERDGTSSKWRINERCLSCFPTTAEVVMGRAPASALWDETTGAVPSPRR